MDQWSLLIILCMVYRDLPNQPAEPVSPLPYQPQAPSWDIWVCEAVSSLSHDLSSSSTRPVWACLGEEGSLSSVQGPSSGFFNLHLNSIFEHLYWRLTAGSKIPTHQSVFDPKWHRTLIGPGPIGLWSKEVHYVGNRVTFGILPLLFCSLWNTSPSEIVWLLWNDGRQWSIYNILDLSILLTCRRPRGIT